ncbi:FAD-dependent oxidoreductase [Roseomonas haemaphysalidis]|uniref:FAD-dependent oxidoreductase n=1 Tax=Roseomonas haemaphysalidis TaxID=2768162 RepID=A0ABS3KRI6_9PROT|nr:FAD-dependent oxidoreductase [Roseomonas haemaphysalidis]MBO1080093.1 FAD-dependent oxidoreductase [Roseomonas haemaphysalidis]
MRLRHPGLAPSAPAGSFSFDGAAVAALPGETIAAALAAAGTVALRAAPDGTMRGLWCGMGACFDCVVTVDGQAGQRACMVKAAPGMVVTSAPGATHPLPALPAEPETVVDVAVIGGGIGGLAAAAPLAAAGLRVVMVDERAEPGGQYLKPVAASHAETGGPIDRQFAESARLRAAARDAGVELWSDATAWSAFAPDEVAVFQAGRPRLLRPRRLLLAPGAYERPVPIPGWTLPGVMTTGAAQTLARAYRVFPGQRVVIGGNGPLNLQLAVELARAGVTVLAVVEEAPRPGWRDWRAAVRAARHAPGLLAQGARYLAVLRARGVPVLWGSRIVECRGGARVSACRIATPEGEKLVEGLDAVTLGHGFIPSTELARQLGARHRRVDRHVGFLATDTAPDGRTSLDTVFAIGDGAGLGGAMVARHRGVLAADTILRDLGAGPLPAAALAAAQSGLAHAEAFQDALWRLFAPPPFDAATIADETIVCRCESVTAGAMRAAIATHGADAGTVKRLTRTGMGRCQGRNCAAVLTHLVAAAGGARPEPFAFFAPRPPAKPVPLAALSAEQAEWAGHRRTTPPAIVPRPTRPPAAALPARTVDVLVVGAGIVGACVARELALAGLDVLALDRDTPGQQASTANAGSLHVQLLSFDFGAKAEAGGGPAAQTLRLGNPAIALWQALAGEIARAGGTPIDLAITGGLMVAETERDMAFLRQKAAIEARFGVETQVIGGNELHAMEPHLSPTLVGAAYCAAEGKINPLTATFGVLNLARAAGATVIGDCPVLGIERDAAGFAVSTAAGPLRARRIVNCAGAWTPRLSGMVGRPVPVAGAPLQMMVTEPGPKLVSRLIAHADRHLSLKQAANGSLLIGGGWSAGLDEATGASTALRWAMQGNAWVAQRVLPAAAQFHLLRVWAGMNINIDGAPILGEMPDVPGFFNCVTSNGYTLAPVVARMTAEAMLRGVSEIDMAPFTLDRF